MKKIETIILLIFVITSMSCFGQQDAQYTQYMYNTMSVNPAYAGTRNAINFTGLYRNQWVGVGGSPKTLTLNGHSPLGKNDNMGIGLSVINDKIKPTQETNIDIDFSYRIKVSQDANLSFGIKAGGHLLGVDFEQLNQFTNSDEALQVNIENKFSPNVGAGIYYYKDTFYLGLSAPNLLATKHFDEISNEGGSLSFLATERVSYYLISGLVVDLTDRFKLKPTSLIKATSGAPIQLDLSVNVLAYEKFTLGIAYRLNSALSGLVAFQISDGLMLGFSYDKDTTDLSRTSFNTGSYEFILRYEIFKKGSVENNEKAFYPRFF